MSTKNQNVKIAFEKEQACDFFSLLKERVYDFVNTHQIGPKAQFKGHLKTLFFIALALSGYLTLTLAPLNKWAFMSLFGAYGFMVAISVMNISHDALHGSYFHKSQFNRALGFFGDIFGPSSFFWRKEHTLDHHIFTNINQHDADLSTTTLLRLCPHQNLKKIHRFQVFYAPFLYCINLIHWIFVSDYKRLIKVYFLNNKKLPKPSIFELLMIFFFKAAHIVLFIVIPIKTHAFSTGFIIGSYVLFLAMMGLTLTTIFQLAHIVENVTFPLPNVDGKIMNTFAKHQLATTSNFGIDSRAVRFLFGGLSFQVEHHLFPHLYHGYLHLISPIVKKTAEEFGIPYYHQPSLWIAIKSHITTLKRLGSPHKYPNTIDPMNLKPHTL